MIEWHRAKDILPEEKKLVLLTYWDVNGDYTERTTVVCHRLEDRWIYDDGYYTVNNVDDQWAYINLPEKDGDSD